MNRKVRFLTKTVVKSPSIKDTIQFYINMIVSISIGISSIAVAFLALRASNKQAEMAELTYRLEKAKNAPDIRINYSDQQEYNKLLDVLIVSGFARVENIEVGHRIVTMYYDNSDDPQFCASSMISVPIKNKNFSSISGRLASIDLSNNRIEELYRDFSNELLKKGMKDISLFSGKDEIRLVVKVDYTNILGEMDSVYIVGRVGDNFRMVRPNGSMKHYYNWEDNLKSAYVDMCEPGSKDFIFDDGSL